MAEERSMEEGNHANSSEEENGYSSDKDSGLSISVPFLQKIIAEVFGTYFLIFAGCAAVTVNKKSNGTVSFPGIFIVWGLAVTVMIYAVGHISGAHLNPAVTIAFASCRRFPWKQLKQKKSQIEPNAPFGRAADVLRKAVDVVTKVPAYVAAQIVGSILASGTLRLLFGGHRELFAGTIPAGSEVQSLFMEFIISFYLMFVISGVATDNRAIGELAGLAVGATVLLNVAIAGPISGASMNPARTLGPAIIANRYKSIWVYMIGPISGTVAGTWAYNLIRYTDKPLREITKSSSFLKSFKKNNSS